MGKYHDYAVKVVWVGQTAESTQTYTSYGRDHIISMPGKPDLLGSADPAFRGDATRWNPEDLLLASLSSCHMLWYLHFCSSHKISVQNYEDNPQATMVVEEKGLGKFTKAILKPRVMLISGSDKELALSLHEKAHAFCFIANSVNFSITLEPTVVFQA